LIGEKFLENGFLSKAGWTIYNDTDNLARNPLTNWVEERNIEGIYQDIYLFCYGHNYKELLKDASLIFGK